eukprot:2578550-Amphidinium_carterae.1
MFEKNKIKNLDKIAGAPGIEPTQPNIEKAQTVLSEVLQRLPHLSPHGVSIVVQTARTMLPQSGLTVMMSRRQALRDLNGDGAGSDAPQGKRSASGACKPVSAPVKNQKVDPQMNQCLQATEFVREINKELDNRLAPIDPVTKARIKTQQPEDISDPSEKVLAVQFCHLVAQSRAAQSVLLDLKDKWMKYPTKLSEEVQTTVQKAIDGAPPWRPRVRKPSAFQEPAAGAAVPMETGDDVVE